MADKLQVFLDTNVFIDYIQERPIGFNEAFSIFELSAKEDIHLLVTDLSISNMKYSTRKDIPTADFYATIKGIRELFTIVPVGEQAVDRALAIEAKDFEDALQYFAAEQAGAQVIVTRNVKDFAFADTVEVLEPHNFLFKYFPEEL
ncbi:MAG: type II toxin-antitoxin system VapC family toxin [Prevotella sp.]|nr:type II toxin-antitoxin system VapC family toxin [Prevotella sp.]